MSDFDGRWQRLVETARGASGGSGGLHSAEDLAAHGLAFAAEQRRTRREGRALALSVLTFAAFLCGAGAAADALAWGPRVHGAARELTDLPGNVPAPRFVRPIPLEPDALAPARALEALERWWLAETAEPKEA